MSGLASTFVACKGPSLFQVLVSSRFLPATCISS